MSASSEQVKSLIIQTCYLLFGALCISTRSGYSYAPAVLLLMSLPVLCQKQSYQALDKNSGGNVIAAATPQLHAAAQAVLRNAE